MNFDYFDTYFAANLDKFSSVKVVNITNKDFTSKYLFGDCLDNQSYFVSSGVSSGICINNCPSGYFKEDRFCHTCPKFCHSCDKAECLECISNTDLIGKLCFTE